MRWFRPSAIQRPAARTLAVPIRRGMPLSAHRRLPVPPPGACWRSCGNRRLCGFLHRDGGENSSERHGSRRFTIFNPATIDVTKRKLPPFAGSPEPPMLPWSNWVTPGQGRGSNDPAASPACIPRPRHRQPWRPPPPSPLGDSGGWTHARSSSAWTPHRAAGASSPENTNHPEAGQCEEAGKQAKSVRSGRSPAGERPFRTGSQEGMQEGKGKPVLTAP